MSKVVEEITATNWRNASLIAAARFACGWLHYSYVSHYFREVDQRSICGEVGRTGVVPDDIGKPREPCRKCLAHIKTVDSKP